MASVHNCSSSAEALPYRSSAEPSVGRVTDIKKCLLFSVLREQQFCNTQFVCLAVFVKIVLTAPLKLRPIAG